MIARLEFELAYFEAVAQYFSHYTMETHLVSYVISFLLWQMNKQGDIAEIATHRKLTSQMTDNVFKRLHYLRQI